MLNCYCQLSSSVIFRQYGVSQSECKIDRPRPGLSRLSPFSYPEPFLRAVERGALAKSISNWHLIGYNEGYCSNTGYILLPCFYGIRFWIWPEPLVAPRVRRALGTRMVSPLVLIRKPWERGWMISTPYLHHLHPHHGDHVFFT